MDKKTEESLLYQRFLVGLPVDIANTIRTAPDCQTTNAAAIRAGVLLAHRRPLADVLAVTNTVTNNSLEPPTPSAVEVRLSQVERELQQLRLAADPLPSTEKRESVAALAVKGGKRRQPRASAGPQDDDYSRQGIQCYECSGYGHVARWCANRRAYGSGESRYVRQSGYAQQSGNGRGAPAGWGAGGRQ